MKGSNGGQGGGVPRINNRGDDPPLPEFLRKSKWAVISLRREQAKARHMREVLHRGPNVTLPTSS